MKYLILSILFINLLLKRNNYLLLILNTEIILLYIITINLSSFYNFNIFILSIILLLFAAIESAILLYIII